MKVNENNFFLKKDNESSRKRARRIYKTRRIIRRLMLDSYGVKPTPFLKAFDYFTNNPEQYDGSSFKEDSYDVDIIDLEALKHDFDYITLWKKESGLKWLKKKIKADVDYKNNYIMFNGGGVPKANVILGVLIISTPLYWVYKKIKDV